MLAQNVSAKRLTWFVRNQDSLTRSGEPLRDSYPLFCERYLGLSCPQDGEIVAASASRLVMRWWNACPPLEACRILGLDTREACRLAYHKPVQALIAQIIDPNLEFGRNYQAIRPYTRYCEEILTLGGAKP